MNRLALVALCGLATWGCDPDPSGTPEPGTLALSISTPHQQESAFLLRITGPGISNVRLASGADVLRVSDSEPGEIKVIVVGNITSGRLLLFDIPDMRDLKMYSVEPLDVASPDFALRVDLDGYGFSLDPG